MGNVSVTQSGKHCINWDVILDNEDWNEHWKFVDGNVSKAEDHCRNPDGYVIPWCFLNENYDEDNCAIPKCCE